MSDIGKPVLKMHCNIITSTVFNVEKLQHETLNIVSILWFFSDPWATIQCMRQEVVNTAKVNVNINKQKHF